MAAALQYLTEELVAQWIRTVNDYIKSRDFWIPFAPSMLTTDALKYLKD